MTNAANNKELYLTAHAAAVENHTSLISATDLDINSTGLSAFNATGHDKRDWPRWYGYFTERIRVLRDLERQPSVSSQAEKEAERIRKNQEAIEAQKQKNAAQKAATSEAPAKANTPATA